MRQFKLKDYLVSVLLIFFTLLYFCDKYLVLQDLKTVIIFGYEIGSFGFPDYNHLVFYSKMKLLILFFSITWYLTCRHWWKSAILIIITIEFLKLITALNHNSLRFDEIDFIISLPITIPIILLLFFLSKKINNYNLLRDLLSNLDSEIDTVFFELNSLNEEKFRAIEDDFRQLKKEHDSKSYFEDLKNLRDKFYDIC